MLAGQTMSTARLDLRELPHAVRLWTASRRTEMPEGAIVWQRTSAGVK